MGWRFIQIYVIGHYVLVYVLVIGIFVGLEADYQSFELPIPRLPALWTELLFYGL